MRVVAASLMIAMLASAGGARRTYSDAKPTSAPAVTVLPIQFTMPGRHEMAMAQQQGTGSYPPQRQGGGYMIPVQPQHYQRACGTISTDICEVPVTIPPGATGEQLYQMARQAEGNRQKGQALSYLKKSAELGYVPAEYALGHDYMSGTMFESDWPRRGAYWLGLAARQGDRAAELELGICYEDGNCNVPRDQAQAIVLLKAAAEQHSALAEQRIGLDYEIGNGLPHDRPLAVSWLRRAGADGAPGATKTADVLSRTREGQLHSVGEIDALVNPPPPPRKLKPGECPSFQTYLAGPRAQAQQYLFCQAHPGCPSSSAGWNGPRCPG